jgi:DNA repair protein RecO (recombination protein O)
LTFVALQITQIINLLNPYIRKTLSVIRKTNMEKTYNTQGIVLLKKDWRENDSFFVIYARDYGKLKLHGVGMKKIKSKLAGQLATPGVIDLMIAKAKTQDKIAGAFLREKFGLNLETDYKFYCLLLEIIEKGTREGQADEALWQLIVKSINWLISAKNNDEKKVVIEFFIFKLMNLLGYKPEVEACVGCRKTIGLEFFNFWENGLMCADCLSKIKDKIQQIKLTPATVDALKLFYQKKDQTALVMKKNTIEEIWNFVKIWAPYVFEKEIRSFGE